MTETAPRESVDPPEVTKRRVRRLLRQTRESKGFTQKEVADRLLWSLSKLTRIESGVTLPAPSDVRSLLIEYDASERLDEAVELVRLARMPDRWDPFRDIISPNTHNLFSNERAASVIQKFEPSLVPGLFQSEDYRRGLLRSLGASSKMIERRIEITKRRQELLDEADCPTIEVIIGEAVISRPIGGNSVMLAQIDRLKELASRPKITIQIMPFAIGAHPGMGSAFTVLEFRDSELDDLVYLEEADRDSIVRENREDVEKYRERFATLQELALPAADFAKATTDIASQRFGAT